MHVPRPVDGGPRKEVDVDAEDVRVSVYPEGNATQR
jgi:hypothetical protein